MAARTTTYEGTGSAACAGVLLLGAAETADISLPLGLDVTIGRGPACGIRIDDPSVSRRHAELRWDGSAAVRVRDLGSHNGTWVGGHRIAAPALTATGAEITIGPRRLLVYVRSDRAPPEDRREIATTDPAMRRALDVADRAAGVDSAVLIVGETGTGKELVARRIHARGRRAAGPFIAVNCGAIPEALAAAELFGHERGAFTGAASDRPGLFEQAAGGTLFFDEIGELPARIQVMLLRVLQERVVARVGGAASIGVDARIVAATHRDLDAMVRSDRFRRDLLFRLDVIRLELPPLRARPDDIVLLAEQFLRELDRSGGAALPPDALHQLRSHSWPGNARELRNVIERALAESTDGHLGGRALRAILGDAAPATALPEHLSDVERERVARALDACGGNRSRAARLLGITRGALLHRMRKHRLGAE